MQVQDILAKDLVGDEWLTEEELRFLMSVTDEEQLQLIYKKGLRSEGKIRKACSILSGVSSSSQTDALKNCNYCGIRLK